MSETPERPKLSSEQIIARFESQLNRAVPLNFLTGFSMVVVALLVAFFVGGWLGPAIGVALIVAGGFLQKLLIIRVTCPACGARVLGRIYSIVQARNVRECPNCHVTLRT